MALADADEGAYVFVAHQFGSVPSLGLWSLMSPIMPYYFSRIPRFDS